MKRPNQLVIGPGIIGVKLPIKPIKQKINRDAKHAKQLKIDATPMLVVDGKYIIETKRSYKEMLDILDYVIELQRPNS